MITTAKDLFKGLKENSDAFDFNSVSNELLKNKDVIKGIISKRGHFLKKLPEEIIDSEIAAYALERSIENFKFLPESYRFNTEFVSKLSLTGKDTTILKYASPDILANKIFILSSLKKDRKNFKEHYNARHWWDGLSNESDSLYYYLDDNLKSDIEIIKAFENISPNIFKDIPSKFRQNVSICRQFISVFPLNYEYADIEVKKNKELAKDMCIIYGGVLKYIKDFFCNDIEIAEIALLNYGLALEHFSSEIRNNKRIVELAINNNYGSFKYASLELRGDIDIVKNAISQDGFNLEFASKELRNDEEIVKMAISHKKSDNDWGSKSCGGALKFASESILSNKKIALIALPNEVGSDWGGDHISEKPLYSFLPDSLKNDIEIAITAINSNSKCIPFLVESVLGNEEVLSLIKEIKSEEENKQDSTDSGWGNSDWS